MHKYFLFMPNSSVSFDWQLGWANKPMCSTTRTLVFVQKFQHSLKKNGTCFLETQRGIRFLSLSLLLGLCMVFCVCNKKNVCSFSISNMLHVKQVLNPKLATSCSDSIRKLYATIRLKPWIIKPYSFPAEIVPFHEIIFGKKFVWCQTLKNLHFHIYHAMHSCSI